MTNIAMLLLYAVSLAFFAAVVSAGQRVYPDLHCSSDSDCSSVPSSSCTDSARCHCSDDKDFYSLDPSGCYTSSERSRALFDLREQALSEHLACAENSHCGHIPDSTCEEGQCTCVEPKRYSTSPEGCFTKEERTAHLNLLIEKQKANQRKLYMGDADEVVDSDHVFLSNQPPSTSCNSDTDCKQFDNAVCRERRCVCDKGDLFHGYGDRIGCYGHSRSSTFGGDVPERRGPSPMQASRPVETVGNVDCDRDEECSSVVENSGCHPEAKLCACFRGFYSVGPTHCAPIDRGTPCHDKHASFCHTSAVKRLICSGGSCSCPEKYPTYGDGLFGKVCLNNELEEMVRQIKSRGNVQRMDERSRRGFTRNGGW